MKAFLVCGAQRSGTRMLTQAISAAGAVYLPLNFRKRDGDPYDQLDRAMAWKDFFRTGEDVVLHFSLPKQQHWPDLKRFRLQLESHLYSVKPVGIMRDWHANISSMMAPHFVENRKQGEIVIRKVWSYLFHMFPDDLLVVNYEAFTGSAKVRKRILTVDLGLPRNPTKLDTTQQVKKDFEDQNDKWYGTK